MTNTGSTRNASSIVNRQPSIANIVVVRLGAMGDILFTTPALRGLKAKYPGCHLTYIAMKKWAFLFRESPSVDRFVGLSYRDPKALGRLTHESFDFLVNFHETEDGARICQALDVRERRGHQWLDGKLVSDENSALLFHDKKGLMQLYEAKISYPDLYCRIAGVTSNDPYRFDFHSSYWDLFRASLFLHAHGCDTTPGPIALHTHSRGTPSKEWPIASVLAVTRAMPDRRFIVLGYRPDRDRTRVFESEPNIAASYHPITVQAGILRRCSLFVGIDSGPRQIAAAVGTRALCLFGPRPETSLAPRPEDRALTVDTSCAPCFDKECSLGGVCLERLDPALIVKTIREMETTG